MGEYFKFKLNEQEKLYGVVEDVRGFGLMLGTEISVNYADIVNIAREQVFL